MIDLSSFDAKVFIKELGLSGSVLAVDFPPEFADALGISPQDCLSRSDWSSWLPRVNKANHLLLWATVRRDDDQQFLSTLARILPKGTTLWSFHHMLLHSVERLTGDAVQMLLTTDGLADGRCANTGLGYYVRSFVRAAGTKAESIESALTEKRGEQDDVQETPAPKAQQEPAPKPTRSRAPKVVPSVKSSTKTVVKKPEPATPAKPGAKKVKKKIVAKVSKKASKKTAAKRPAKKLAKKSAKKASKKTSKRVVKKVGKKPVSEKSAKKTAKKAAKKASKKAAKKVVKKRAAKKR